METTLKQRLIGAAVIIALAVIFVPMILDGSGRQESVALDVEVPPEPTFTFESELPDPKKLDELPEIDNTDSSSVEDNTAKETGSISTTEEKVVETDTQPAETQVASSQPVLEATENKIKD